MDQSTEAGRPGAAGPLERAPHAAGGETASGDEAHADGAGPASFRRSLSFQLLWLTILFALFAQLIVLIPSVAEERLDWFSARIEAAYLVGLALEAPQAGMIEEDVIGKIFATANILGVTVDQDGASMLIYAPTVDEASAPEMHYYDLSERNPLAMIVEAWATVFSRGDDMVRVIGKPTYAQGREVGIIISQRALRRDLIAFARNILGLSLIISTVTAALVYVTLNNLIVRPARRLTRNMIAFHANPEDPGNIIEPSGRDDEIGAAEHRLHALEQRIHDLLSQRRRLAALGAGVSKISHDLRNILASAQLMSDRLAKSEDPRVRSLSPRLIQALDRAIALSRDTLNYSRMEPATLAKSHFAIAELVDEVFEDNAAMDVAFVNETPPELFIVADRNHLYRALFNLVRNAVEAFAVQTGDDAAPQEKRVTIRTRMAENEISIDITDNGPGIAESARAHLFEPFRGSLKPGGSGLGAAIAYEIAHAHGGALALVNTGPSGTIFQLTLPA